ncbi:MAG: tyrosine-protein phosphatase [Clostridia bacterium]|nr:tyrosine-protein phosphatase [Clostridia bacterium]
MKRRYITENIVNCRDLGGYPAADGGVTAFGRVLRCGILKDPTESDMKILEEFGIKTVIDLRGNSEKADMPDVFERMPEYDYHHISLLETNPIFSKKCTDIGAMYIMSLTEYRENYAAVLRLISNLNEPFLFHCFAGKDRTGLLAAMLLGAAGVSREDIVADYQVSFTYFKPAYEREIAADTGIIWEKNPAKFYSDPEVMERILDYFDTEFGGIKGYFGFIGLSEDEINRISKILK